VTSRRFSRRQGSPQGGGDPKREKRTVDLGVATIIAAVILAGGGALGAFIGRATAPAAASAQASSVSSGKADLPALRFSLTYHQLVPWCTNTLNGTGRIPNGDSLIILDREVSVSDQAASNSYYSLDGAVVPSGDSWSISPIYIGPPNKVTDFYVELTGILVPDGIAQFLTHITLPWGSPGLPPSLESVNAFVLRDNDLSQCS
jgi:hypothetical protein